MGRWGVKLGTYGRKGKGICMFYTEGISVVKRGFVWSREEVVVSIIRGYVAEETLWGAVGDLWNASGWGLVWCKGDCGV